MAGCEESCGFYFVFALFTFFVWMDLSFFDELEEQGSFVNASTAKKDLMFPVKTVKARMTDHTDYYINLPSMQFLNQNCGIYTIPGVTPNLISGLHLFVAVIAAKCFMSGTLSIRRVGALLFEIRSQLDILDGVVFRAQQNMKDNFFSAWGSIGYLVDATADMCGGILLAAGCTVFLNRYPPWKRVKTKLRDEESGKKMLSFENDEEERYVHVSRRAINIKMLLVTLQIIARSGFWDHYVQAYTELLEKPNDDIPRDLQAEVLSYRSTWSVMWMWKVTSADACLQFTILAVLFDKLWVWLQMLNYFGPLQLLFVIVMTQLHLMEARAYLLGT